MITVPQCNGLPGALSVFSRNMRATCAHVCRLGLCPDRVGSETQPTLVAAGGRVRTLLVVLVFWGPAAACENEAPESQAASLTVRADPRVEFMSLIFRLAGNPEYMRGLVPSYVEDADAHFAPFRDHDVVRLARRLRAERGVSFDAVMGMAVHVDDAASLAARMPLDPRPAWLDARWQPAEAEAFLAAARRFVTDSSFDAFVARHQALYALTESRLAAVLEEHVRLEWFDAFFGGRPGTDFIVVPALFNGPNSYGPRCQPPDGREQFYCILGVWQVDAEGAPRFDARITGTVIHEFCHSYANPIIDRHADDLEAAGQKLFARVAEPMRQQAYGHWRTMLYESLVRACVVRYTLRYEGRWKAWTAARAEQARGFVWMPELVTLLSEYEADRAQYPTLDSFGPRLVEFFHAYAEKLPDEPPGAAPAAAAQAPQVVAMEPADASEVDTGLDRIRVVFDRPMQDGSWSLVGGGPSFPEVSGRPSYDAAGKVWTVAVKLEPGRSYQFMLNSDRFQGFRTREGVPLAPVTVRFKTQ
jgi:hypothetical protein